MTAIATAAAAPRVFVSYSHDSQDHRNWVLTLATRLVANGVDVILDQWDLRFGSDLPRFMETGLTGSDRVLAVCTGKYVEKANVGSGGVGYEKMILTAQLMQDVTTDRIVPVVRDNGPPVVMPTFLSSRLYIDFRDPAAYEARYSELLRDLHGEQVSPRPPLGPNPFRAPAPALHTPTLSLRPERYVSPALAGRVTFDYSNNNGRFVLGAGDMLFETAWSSGGRTSIHAYTDPPSIRSVALVTDTQDIGAIADASGYDSSSRVRTPRLGEIVVWQNTAGYYAATKIEALNARSNGDPYNEVMFSYAIQSNRSPSFTGLDGALKAVSQPM